MLLWNDETDTSGEAGPADKLTTGVGGEISLSAFVTGTKGAAFYKSLTDVIMQMESSIVLVDNSMQAVVNQMGHASETLADNIRKSFADASLEILQLGGTEKEALAIQTETLDVLGRNVTLSKDQYTTLFSTSKVTGQSTKELEEAFLNIGGNIDQIATDMESVLHISNNLGVNAKAVSEKVVENMQQLNRVGFQGGVEGLARMAAKAQVLRTDMSEVFELADDLMSPEKAIEMASALQRLGATSTSLIDPLRLMDLAQNDVGELQNQLGEMFKTYTYFDEKTKKFQIMPSARRDLKQLSSELGIPLDQIEKMALGSADLDKKLSEIDFSGLDVDEDTKTMIANMATMNKEGKYVIKNELGEDQELSKFIESYDNNTEGLKSFLDQKAVDETKSAEEKMIERADQQLSHLKRIEALNESAAKSLALSAARGAYGKNLLLANEEIAKFTNQPIIDRAGPEGKAAEGFEKAAKKFSDAVDKMRGGDAKGGMVDLGKAGKEIITSVGGTSLEILTDYITNLGLNSNVLTGFATKIQEGITEALSKFENPGTLKVTIYGDKTGNPKKLEDAVSNPKDIENENTENMSKLFDVSLSQLDQTGVLVKLFERVSKILENIGQNDGISVRELVQKDKSIETKTIDKESLTEVNTIVADTIKNTSSEFEKIKQIYIESGISFKEIMNLQEKFIKENYVISEKGAVSRETGEQVSVENIAKSFNDYLMDYSKKITFNQNKTENVNTENNTANEFTTLNQTFAEMIKEQKIDSESFRETFREMYQQQMQIIEKSYIATEKGTFISKETGEEKTADEVIQSVKDSVAESIIKMSESQGAHIMELKSALESVNIQDKDALKSIANITQQELTQIGETFYQRLLETNNNLSTVNDTTNTEENNSTSVTTFLNQKTQSIPSQTNPEIIQLLSQTNETFREVSNSTNQLVNSQETTSAQVNETLREVSNSTNQSVNSQETTSAQVNETLREVSNSTNLSTDSTNKLNNTFESTNVQTNDVSNTVRSEIERAASGGKINIDIEGIGVPKSKGIITPELFPNAVQVPEFAQPNFTNFTPPDFAKVENYMRNVEEKTYNENKTEKKEQKVDFGPLKIQFDVTGYPQNNSQATDALLDYIKRDRRFGLAFENMLKGINFGLLEKMK